MITKPEVKMNGHQPQAREIVIIGAGLIGVSTAYYLSKHLDLHPESKITLVEEENVGTGSSGYASGLLIKEEGYEMSMTGYDLHRSLAKDFGGELKWGYKAIDLYDANLDVSSSSSFTTSHSFLPPSTSIHHRSLPTAICQPSDFTRHLCGLFLTHPGASLMIARATSLTFFPPSSNGKPKERDEGSVGGCGKERRRINGINIVQIINGVEEVVHLKADTIIVSTGIKTPMLLKTLLGEKTQTMTKEIGQKEWEGLVIKPKERPKPCAVRISQDEAEGEAMVVVRDDGTVYISRPLSSPSSSNNKDKSNLITYVESLSPKFASSNGTLILSQSKWSSPTTPDDQPLIEDLSLIPRGVDGLWVGIGGNTTQGPAIGLNLASRILDGNT
ncbi:hypothetical protein L486_03048 [Kwoniella mangroviensis CBS 10435]|uniref:FAD dependent oxidoreductase domain-containing protein n=1 Tax=Kwoniella mangroviensis CBS 10435 TaxID=1331196 RepID=A0A1B9IXW4_9TREE|nr:hypothetical protein L486_03048 [Kwoniella mangroviensis CBS 10435]